MPTVSSVHASSVNRSMIDRWSDVGIRFSSRLLKLALINVVLLMVVPMIVHAQAMSGTTGFLDQFDVPVLMVGVNSVADDYAPVWQASQQRLMISTERSGTTEVWQVPYEARNTSSMPQPASIVDGTFNEHNRWRAYLSFGNNGEAVGVAFVAHEGQAWPTIVTVPVDDRALNIGHPIPTILRNGFDSQPALSPDGTHLVYVSDREGGSGGLDLWVCDRRTDLEWDVPVQLSNRVNSQGNEVTPCFISNDSLIYASNGYGGKGGFDLFLVVLRDGVWQDPEPLDWFNTEFDETDPMRLPDGTMLFASNRPGGEGGFDVWMARVKASLGKP